MADFHSFPLSVGVIETIFGKKTWYAIYALEMHFSYASVQNIVMQKQKYDI